MKNCLYLFLIIFLFFTCKTIEKKIVIKSDVNEINYQFKFSDDILIKGKKIFDASSDLKIRDSTDDKTAKKYIFDVENIKDLRLKEAKLNENIFNDLNNLLKDSNIKISGTNDCVYKLKINLVKYEIGEYNLISNIPSKYYYNIMIIKNNLNTALIRKHYEINSDIFKPTENHRIEEVSKQISFDLIKILKNILSRQVQDATKDKQKQEKK